MASRMERYYRPEAKVKRRTEANQELYRKMYDISEYSNIEGIATIDKANEIDITKVKNMLKNREEYQKQRDLRSLIHKEEPKVQHMEMNDSFEDDNRVYDITNVLSKAKKEKPVQNEKYRSLGDTNYNILKSLQIDRTAQEEDSNLEETMTNTSLLNGLADSDLSADLLGNLKSGNNATMVGKSDAIHHLIEQAKEEERKKLEQSKKIELDKSFFTSSLNFGDEDFEEVSKLTDKNRKKRKLKKRVMVLSALAISIAIIIIVYLLIK